MGAEFLEGPDVGAGDAAEEDVAQNGDFFIFEIVCFKVFYECEAVEEGLGGVFMSAVAGVDYRDFDDFADEGGGPCEGVADDDGVGAEGLDIEGGVVEGFAFGETAGFILYGDDVSAEVFGGDFEGDACAGTGFEEEVNDCFPLEGGGFF